jgi:hypothetical protein
MKALPVTFSSLLFETVTGILVMLVFYANFLYVLHGITKEDILWLSNIFKRKEKA